MDPGGERMVTGPEIFFSRVTSTVEIPEVAA
jgi:hypothetical protein